MGLWKKICGAALAAAAIVFCLLSVCYAPPETGYKRPQKITVVSDDKYPPYIYRDSKGKLQGIIVDRWKLWEKQTGVAVNLVGMDWAKALQFMAAGKADAIDSIFLTKERTRLFDFSKPYATIRVPIFFHRGISGISGAESLRGFTVGVKEGDACIQYLKDHAINTLKEYPSYKEMIKAAQAKEIRLFCMDEPPALYYLNKLNIENEYRESEPLYTGQLHWAVAKGKPELFAVIEKGFSKIPPREYKAIYKKWMGSGVRKIGPSYARYLLYSSTGTTFLILTLVLWNYALRRKVTAKTSQLQLALDALRGSEKQYRELVENANSIIVRMDDLGNVTFFNEFARGFFDYTEKEIIGKSMVGTIVPAMESTGRDLAAMLKEIARDPSKFNSNINENMRRNGERVWIAWTNIPIRYKDGRVAEVLCVGNDITERKRAEEQLRLSERRLKKAEIAVRSGNWEYIVASDKVIASEGARIIYGVEEWELPMPQVQSFTIPEHREIIDNALKGLVENGEPYNIEFRIRRQSDGQIIDIHSIAEYFPEEGRIFGVIQDITDRKQAQEALQQSERNYREIFNAVDDSIFILDADTGAILDINDSVPKLFGYSRQEVLGDMTGSPSSGVSPYSAEESQYWITRTMAEGPQVFHWQSRKKDGELFWVEVSLKSAQISRERRVLAVVRDITKRKQVEEGLREAEKRYRTLFEGANDGTIILTPEGTITESNQTALRLFGLEEAGEFRGCTVWNYSPLTQPDGRDSKEKGLELLNAVVEGKPQRFYWQHTKKDGTPFDAEVSLNYIQLENIRLIQAMVRDITQIRQAQNERKSLEERLQRAEKMEALGTLAGGVAHDLNNALGVVVGYAELLAYELDGVNPARAKALQVLKGGQKAAAIVQDLLTLARRGVSNRMVLNLNKIVADCKSSAEFAAICANHPGVSLETDLEADLLNLSGSYVHLEKSVMNLVYNAVEAMPGGGVVKMSTRNQYLDKPVSGYDEVKAGDYVVFTISDTGEGISAEDLKRVFEPFYTKKAMGRSGTGLGLAVVWGTVKDHDGYINVESLEGKGTTLTLYFPVTRQQEPSQKASPLIAEYMGKGQSILVVDDVQEQLELACLMLRKLNYSTYGVGSGEEAIERLRHNKVDLVVLDMIMDPGMDGLTTYTKILEIHPGQKAIIVSGFSETERVTRAQALGAGAYVKKPYILEKLGTAVKKELERR
ncbi:MAG: PAS domain S-box protein [Syntrophobacteraceae bacterium]